MQADLKWLENPEVFRVNRLDAHSDHTWYETPQQMECGAQTLRQSLNGQWRFAWSACPAQRPADFYREDYEVSRFGTIAVPGHIEMQGYGQLQYINTMYPWDGRSNLRPPHIDPDDNPVGSYVKTFDLEDSLRGKRVCVSFAGVEQAFYVWCNGHFVGYSEDSFTPSDFDLTPYVRDEANRLCVEVYKRSSAAWLEDQDFFRFSGIFREVYLYAKPEVHVEDVWLKAGLLDDNTTGTLDVRLTLSRAQQSDAGLVTVPVAVTAAAAPAGVTVHCRVCDAYGAVLHDAALALVAADTAAQSGAGTQAGAVSAGQGGQGSQAQSGGAQNGAAMEPRQPDVAGQNSVPQSREAQVGGVFVTAAPLQFASIHAWHTDSPALYTVMLSVYEGAANGGTQTAQSAAQAASAAAQANGASFGATAEQALCEIVPYRIGFRRVALENGIVTLNGERMVFNGVNRHEWSAERGRAITEADMRADMEAVRRNNINAVRTSHYPNQSLWYDLCDENGIYLIDETNLESHGSWQKMGACEPSWNVPGDKPEWCACVVDRAQSMFERDKNHVSIVFWSCGNESYAGTCIEAMADYFHAQDDSRLVHYEGVHWNRKFAHISDVESRMYATPEEIRAYMKASPAKPFILCEYMHNMGNSLGGMESYVRLLDEFEQYQGGFIWDFKDQALLYTDAQGRRVLGYGGDFGERPTDYNFSANGILFADGTEKPAMQDVRYWYAPPAQRALHDAQNARAQAAAQRELAAQAQAETKRAAAAQPLTLLEGDLNLGVRGDGFEVLFSYGDGGPVSLRYGGKEWLHRAPKPAFWRATTENDKGNGFSEKSSVWMGADLWARCTGVDVREKSADRVELCYRYEAAAAPGAFAEMVYTVDRLGRLGVRASYHGAPDLPQLPAFGVRFATVQPCAAVRRLGLSGETYPDRCKGGVFGAYTGAPHVADYPVPQECGCHVGTLQAELCEQNGLGKQTASLVLTAEESPFAFSALPCPPQALETAWHKEELPQICRTVVTVYAAMRGVGGIDSWGADVEPAYQLSAAQNYEVAFTVQGTKPIQK